MLCVGANERGTIGNPEAGRAIGTLTPARHPGDAVQVRAGGERACMLDADHEVWCSGGKLCAANGDGAEEDRFEPVCASW